MSEFEQDVDLDAKMVLNGFVGGESGFMMGAMALGFAGPDEAVARAEWMKKQSDEYKEQVINRATAILRERERKHRADEKIKAQRRK